MFHRRSRDSFGARPSWGGSSSTSRSAQRPVSAEAVRIRYADALNTFRAHRKRGRFIDGSVPKLLNVCKALLVYGADERLLAKIGFGSIVALDGIDRFKVFAPQIKDAREGLAYIEECTPPAAKKDSPQTPSSSGQGNLELS